MEKIFGLLYLFPCHRIERRCFCISTKPMPICSRCLGVLAGSIISLPFWMTGNEFGSLTIILGCLPMLIDWSIQTYFGFESNNKRRFITGLICGYFLAFFMLEGVALTGRWFYELILREAV